MVLQTKKYFKKWSAANKQLAAHPLIGRPSLNNCAAVSGKGNRFNTRWRWIQRQTDIDHHSPRPISIICHFPDPPFFSLPTTFKGVAGSYKVDCCTVTVHRGTKLHSQTCTSTCTCLPVSWNAHRAMLWLFRGLCGRYLWIESTIYLSDRRLKLMLNRKKDKGLLLYCLRAQPYYIKAFTLLAGGKGGISWRN